MSTLAARFIRDASTIADGLDAASLAVLETTIATRASQTSFTLTAGSADNDAYNGCPILIIDQTTSAQRQIGSVLDYTGSTKTVTLAADPGIFTHAVGDTIRIYVKDPQVQADTAAILVDTSTTLDDFIDTEAAAILADTAAIEPSAQRTITNTVTEAADAAYTAKFTATGIVLIDGVWLIGNSEPSGSDSTSCAVEVTDGGYVLIDTTDAAAANLSSATSIVDATSGKITTGGYPVLDGQTIGVDLLGSGSTPVALTIVIRYTPVAGGSLATV